MFLNDVPINYLGVLLAAIAYFIIGAIWYAPSVFGSRWMRHEKAQIGFLAEQPSSSHIGSYAGEFIIALVMAYVLSLLIQVSLADEVVEGIAIALWIWTGFIATTHFSAVLWGRKTLKSFFIHAGFMLVGLIAMGSIIMYFGP